MAVGWARCWSVSLSVVFLNTPVNAVLCGCAVWSDLSVLAAVLMFKEQKKNHSEETEGLLEGLLYGRQQI